MSGIQRQPASLLAPLVGNYKRAICGKSDSFRLRVVLFGELRYGDDDVVAAKWVSFDSGGLKSPFTYAARAATGTVISARSTSCQVSTDQ